MCLQDALDSPRSPAAKKQRVSETVRGAAEAAGAEQYDNAGQDFVEFRSYSNAEQNVKEHYSNMRRYQCMEYVRRMEERWLGFDKAKMTIKDAFDLLSDFVDSSDPDTALPNLDHMLQTAEAMREAGEPDWMQLVGLLHDLGKVMGCLSPSVADGQTKDGPQWGMVGDTWVVGCKIPAICVYPEYSATNPDREHPLYSTDSGPYKEGCGLAKLTFAWGHDEYLYRMLVHNKSTIPEEGLQMVRLHSCYPLHGSDVYDRFLAAGDGETLDWVKRFNKYDLYTKADKKPDPVELWPYYQGLIDKYCPGKLDW